MGLEDFLYALRRHRRVPIVAFLIAMLAITFVLATHEEKAPKFRSTYRVAVTEISAPPPELLLQVVADPGGNLTYVLSDAVINGAGVQGVDYLLATTINLPTGNDSESAATGTLDFQVEAASASTAFDVATRIGEEYIRQRSAARDLSVSQRKTATLAAIERIDAEIATLEATTTMKLEDVLAVDDRGAFIYPLNVEIPPPESVPATATTPATTTGLPQSSVTGKIITNQIRTLFQGLEALAREQELELVKITGEEIIGGADDVPVGQAAAIPIEESDALSVFIPIGALLALAIIIGIGGALLLAKLDHTVTEPADAAHVMRAPVLGIVTKRRRSERAPVALDPRAGNRVRQFRSLAATIDAMGTIPKRIFVTAPEPTVEIARVGTNLAVCLAEMGHTVVLVATDPAQLLQLGNLTMANAEGYAEILEQARMGSINGEVHSALQPAPGLSSLWVLPPGLYRANAQPRAVSQLLRALEAPVSPNGSRPDVAIVLGHSMVDDADAAVLAREAGAVLWVLESGITAEESAVAAHERLALTGVDALGVAVVMATGA
jgi:Mrp family chromosome partitioning ATPase